MQRANQLVMEQKPALKSAQASAASPIKSILFVVHDDDGLESRLQAALSLARACSAHVQLLEVIPLQAYTAVDTYSGPFISGEIVEALEEQAAKVRKRLEGHLAKEDVSWSYEVATPPTLPELLKSAAFADLIFMGRQPNWHEFGRTGPGLLGAFVCNVHAPLCIPGEGRKSFDPFGPAVVAWNGSIEGANAVRLAIGLLRMASSVRVIRYVEGKELTFPDTALLKYLSRHGVHPEMESHLPKGEIGEELMHFAAHAEAEYMVMGGYSHSRAAEFLFGGVTRGFLRACPVSLVMAH